MASIGQRTLDVVNLYNSGMPIIDIAKKLEVSPSNVEERLRSYKRFKAGASPKKHVNMPLWTIQNLKLGFDRFIGENGHLPSAYEVDDCPYLPSARHIQRQFGGLGQLREELGYGKVLFNSGANRREILKITGPRGADAEDQLEEILIKRFGKLFVHSEQRFGGSRYRVDFVIYTKNITVGIDVFATNNDSRLIVKNIVIKLPKYINYPITSPLFFLVWNNEISQKNLDDIVARITKYNNLKMVRAVTLKTLLEYLSSLEPLKLPEGYKSL